jgi:hypothetical protein
LTATYEPLTRGRPGNLGENPREPASLNLVATNPEADRR